MKRFGGEVVDVGEVVEVVFEGRSVEDCLVVEAGGWGAGLRLVLPLGLDKVSVERCEELGGRLVVRLGY